MALFKAVVWALIFLTKLRFPPGVSIAIVLKVRSTSDNLQTEGDKKFQCCLVYEKNSKITLDVLYGKNRIA